MATELITDVNFIEDTPAIMLLFRKHHDEMQLRLRKFASTVKEELPLFTALERLNVEARFGDFIHLSFSGDGPFLGKVWAELRRQGWKPDERPTTKGSGTFSTFWRKDGRAFIYMYFSSSVCRRVQVGTKLVETPIYETQCGELPILEDGSKASSLAGLI